jgi:hypothetical protein
MGEITNLNKATSKNESLRTTVPRSIIKQFGLTEYDQLDWNLKAEGGDLKIQVVPIMVFHGRLIELPINGKSVLHTDDDRGFGRPIEEVISQFGLAFDRDLFKQQYFNKIITITLKKENGIPKIDVKEER